MNSPVPTGITALNDLLAPGTLTVIAGRYGHGADILATNIARVASTDHSIPTLFTSCRVDQNQVMERLIAAQAGVDIMHMANHKLTDEDRVRIDRVADVIKAAPLFINTEHRTIGGIARHAGATRARLAVVEGTQLLYDEKPVKNDAQRSEVNAEAFMRLSRSKNIPVVVSIPLNADRKRPVEAPPLMSEFRWRQPFAAAADVVILVHEIGEDRMEITVAKRRNGPTCRVIAQMQRQYDRIVDIPQAPNNVITFPGAGAP